MPFGFLLDLTRVKFGGTRLPSGRRYRARCQPGHGPPGVYIVVFGTLRATIVLEDGRELVLSEFGCGEMVRKIGTLPTPPLYPLLFLAKFDACQIRQHLPALGQVL